jgi:cytochrome c oxidase subunit II
MIAPRRSRVGPAVVAGVVAGVLAAGCAKQGATVQGQEIHDLYVTIALLAAPVFVGVEGALLWCVLRYRRRGEAAVSQGQGGPRSLALFFAIPTIIVAFLYPFGERTLADVQRREPDPVVELRVDGFQWQWTFYYLNEGFFVTGRTLTKVPTIELPVDAPVHVQLEARDVVHELYIPEFLFMRNALPGRPNEFSFTPTRIGTFRGQCAEFCGLYHDQMRFVVKVVSQADYAAWVEDQRKAAQNVDCDPSGPAKLVSKDNSWSTGCLAVTKQVPFTVAVSNLDAGIEHNFALYDTAKRKRTYFQGPRFAGVADRTFQLQALPKGRYYFQCDVHGPAMSGALIVK